MHAYAVEGTWNVQADGANVSEKSYHDAACHLFVWQLHTVKKCFILFF